MPLLTAKIAIDIAKTYVADIFGPEKAYNIGLEEIVFRKSPGVWDVTIGFSRPWDKPTFQSGILPQSERRSLKIVEVDDKSGAVLSVKDRPPEAKLG